jgi:hypothetical protein
VAGATFLHFLEKLPDNIARTMTRKNNQCLSINPSSLEDFSKILNLTYQPKFIWK